ncbi:MAG: hypothetical protein H6739_34890 [Alphaproteobacteria bacterium]|nr:hypothetical protein [Alphaproteobacteria bacterium]
MPIRFRPRDGAILDLESLNALADAAPQALRTALAARWGGVAGVVLSGLELEGAWSSSGPPGTVRPDPQASGVVIGPGRAVVQDADGIPHLVEIKEPLRAAWPTRAGAAVRGVLVLTPTVEPQSGAGGLTVARDQVSVRLGFVPMDRADVPHVLPLGSSVGNGRDWATDLRRIWQPGHPGVRSLNGRLEALEDPIWNAEPEGAVWERQVLGRNWVRYQTMAASALQASRIQLATHAMTTAERVRLLATLYLLLRRSVERAATQLAQVIGPVEEAGVYRAVIEGVGPEAP